jgi:short-subunit dehydrogenase
MDVRDKVAIVTGASSGIGLATARLLAKRGAKVALVARSVDKLAAACDELVDSFVAVADMSIERQVRDMVRRVQTHYGRIDILVNCAGQGYDAPAEHTDVDQFRRLFELDVVGPLVAMQSVIPIMRRQGGGAIVNVSSGTSLMNLPYMGAYSGLKRALNGLTLAAREELKDDGIVVSVVYPYMTATDFEENTIVDSHVPQWEGGSEKLRPPDSAEHVAERILDVIASGEAEAYAHDWMKRLGSSEA